MTESSGPETGVRLPTESDFVVYPEWNYLDQAYAWRNFGGLTLEQAKEKFAENPLHYWEDFMFMGTNAFAFYFPVLDEHLRSVPDVEEPEDDSEAGIIGYSIRSQYEEKQIDPLRPLIPSVLSLAEFVLTNLRRFGRDEEELRRVAEEWSETVRRVREIGAA